jgi:hypothetical protein
MITTTTNIIAITNTDMNRAAFMMAKTNGTINPILLGAKVAMISELKKRLAKGETVEFDYLKKSTGEVRHAIGCLYGALIEPKIKGTGVHNSIYGNITYFDLQKNAFRCFSVETLIKVY